MSTVSSSQGLSTRGQPNSLESEHNPQVAQGATEAGPTLVDPNETASFLEGYSKDQDAASDPNNPSTEQLDQNEIEMRKAADTSDGRQPGAFENHGIKFAFLPSHFLAAVVPGDNEKSAKQLASMMPASLSEGGHLERLMLEPDPAHAGSHEVNEDTLFESAAALK